MPDLKFPVAGCPFPVARFCSLGREGRGPYEPPAALVGVEVDVGPDSEVIFREPRPLFTRSRSSLPTLKKARRLGRTWTASPVRGLRPWYSLYARIEKLPKPRISIPSP